MTRPISYTGNPQPLLEQLERLRREHPPTDAYHELKRRLSKSRKSSDEKSAPKKK